MDKFKISTRLNMLTGVLAVLLFVIGIIGLYGIGKSNDSLRTVYEDRVIALDQLGEVGYLVQRNRVLIMDMMLQPRRSLPMLRASRTKTTTKAPREGIW